MFYTHLSPPCRPGLPSFGRALNNCNLILGGQPLKLFARCPIGWARRSDAWIAIAMDWAPTYVRGGPCARPVVWHEKALNRISRDTERRFHTLPEAGRLGA